MGLRRKYLPATGILSWVLASNIAAAQEGVLTYHNDIGRTGQNTSETVLTPENVNSTRFGRLFSQHVDGDVYAQPLYVPNLTIPGKGVHNIVVVATEADSLYAFDADSGRALDADPLWHVSLLDAAHGASPGATTASASVDLACAALTPQVGITATPVIDPTRTALYVEAFSKENGALVHRLHVLDITTGTERRGSPVLVTARVARKGKNDVLFDPARQLARAGLLLSNGIVYVAYGSHCDRPLFQGWMLAYDAATLVGKGVFVTAPEHGKAAIWMSGAAPAADSKGNVFVATGDGWFDPREAPAGEFGNSILKLAPRTAGLTLADYFTPFNQATLARHDGDLGSGGVLLLPDQPGSHPHVLIEAGKAGTLYLVDRDTMTANNLHYCAGCNADRQIVQELRAAIPGGVWGMPAYWNGTVYVSGSQDILRALSLKEGHLESTPASVSKEVCEYPGCGLSVSANGSRDGILWALQVGGYESKEPAVLRAYDARDLSRLLYASDQHGERDVAGGAVKFSIPTVANGKVYVGCAGQLTVFGLLERP
jgi:outer membrane protein assembly factor BamB